MLTRLSAITPSPTQRCMVGKRRFADPYLLALCVTQRSSSENSRELARNGGTPAQLPARQTPFRGYG